MENIFFDLDGTVTNPGFGITKSVQFALLSFGISVEDLDVLKKFVGPPLKSSFMECYGFDDSKAEAAVQKYREYFTMSGIFENELYPGIPEMLKFFQDRGNTLIIATSKPTVFAKRILDYFEISSYFAFISGSKLSGERADKAEVISFALSNVHGAMPCNSIMVGDRKHDIIGAKKNGLRSIGVLYGYGTRTELTEAGANYIVQSTYELQSLLAEI